MKLEDVMGGAIVIAVIVVALLGARYVSDHWLLWKAKLAEKFKKPD